MKLRLLISTFLTICTAILLTSCGKRVEVPTAHIGKIKTASGLEEGLKYPSSFRLPFSLVAKNELILVETSHFPIKETIKLFMPKDKLNLTFDIRGTMYITPEQSEALFDRIPAKKVSRSVQVISSDRVYTTYGQQLIRSKVRSIISRYSIPQLMDQREMVNGELAKEIQELFDGKKYPLGVIQFGLADIQYPDVIVQAQEVAKEREVAIDTAEAQKQVRLKEAEAALEVARKQQEIDLLEAQTQVLVEQKLNEAVNAAFIQQRALKILDKMATNPNKTFILPSEAFSRPDMLMGVYGKAFNSNE